MLYSVAKSVSRDYVLLLVNVGGKLLVGVALILGAYGVVRAVSTDPPQHVIYAPPPVYVEKSTPMYNSLVEPAPSIDAQAVVEATKLEAESKTTKELISEIRETATRINELVVTSIEKQGVDDGQYQPRE